MGQEVPVVGLKPKICRAHMWAVCELGRALSEDQGEAPCTVPVAHTTLLNRTSPRATDELPIAPVYAPYSPLCAPYTPMCATYNLYLLPTACIYSIRSVCTPYSLCMLPMPVCAPYSPMCAATAHCVLPASLCVLPTAYMCFQRCVMCTAPCVVCTASVCSLQPMCAPYS